MLLDKKLLHTTDSYIKKLEAANVRTVEDLIGHYPRTYENKSNKLEFFSLVNIKEKNSVICTIETIISERTRNGKNIIKAIIKDKSGFLSEAVWFNRKFLLTKFSSQDKVIIFGKPQYSYGKLSFLSPDIEFFSQESKTIKPIYPELNYIPSDWFEKKILELKPYFKDIKNTLPESLRLKKGFQEKWKNVWKIHFPDNEKDFEKRILNILKKDINIEYFIELKFDGLGISITYKDGRISRVLTRGNGVEGEDITINALQIANIPKTISLKEEVEIRGEVVMPILEFVELNKRRLERGEKLFANPRNAASGSLRQLDYTRV